MFPPLAKAKLRWNEPWLFTLRQSTALGWIVRAVMIGVVYGMILALILSIERSPTAPELNPAVVFIPPAIFSILIVALFDVPNLQRTVELSDTEISCVGRVTTYGGALAMIHLLIASVVWNRREIKHIQLRRPGEPGNRFAFGLMTIARKYGGEKQVAIPPTVALEDVANHVHSMGIAVQLSGWQPAAAPEKVP
jgi:hypothetical protein